jgi:predicted AlkP superfamily phosphohydrolase/phosphomutase
MEYLMEHEPSDLTAIVFDGVDKIQHLAYRFLDPKHVPANPTPWEAKVIDLCHSYFKQIDDFLGRTLELLGKDGRLFIASDHGFTASDEIVYINKYLHDLGHLRWNGEVDVDENESIVVERLTRQMGLYDWRHTRAAALTPSCNGVYILNVPPDEYEVFRDKLIDELYALRGADGGQVITEVKKRDEWFAGPWMHRAPDLTLTLRDHGFLSVLNGTDAVVPRKAPVGTHHPLGVLWGVGPGLKVNATASQHNILGVASLLAHSVGVEIPSEYEGKFPADLYEESYLAAHPPKVSWGEAAPPVAAVADASQQDVMDSEEELVLTQRLRSLGYIE